MRRRIDLETKYGQEQAMVQKIRRSDVAEILRAALGKHGTHLTLDVMGADQEGIWVSVDVLEAVVTEFLSGTAALRDERTRNEKLLDDCDHRTLKKQ
jgi:hypothetical protein